MYRSDDFRGGVGLFIKVHHDLSVFIPHVYESLYIEIILTSVKNGIVELSIVQTSHPEQTLIFFYTPN